MATTASATQPHPEPPGEALLDSLDDDQVESFRRDGFLIVEEGLLSAPAIEILRERFAALFAGEYATGIAPDEVNWKQGRDPDDVTRQICNGWRSDDLIAAQVLSERTGRLAARLMGYRGTRIVQDNCLWKPPGARSLGMHQDGSYAGYLVPAEMITCWVALDETHAEGGTIEYVRGSHRWPKVPPDRASFHAPEDWLAPLAKATPEGVEPERVPVVVKPGGCAFHHSLTFHGSGPNQATRERRALVSHLVPVETRFHPTNTDVTYSRYRRRADLSLDESFFPVLWDENGGRSAWLVGLPELP
jgi:2-oxoglutarate-dependent dioxygenase